MLSLLDEFLFHIFFSLPKDILMLGDIMVMITNWSSRLFAAVYIAAIALLLWQRSKKIIPVIIAPALAFVLVQGFRYFYFRPRPFEALEIDSLIYHSASSSLPSMHATSAFVIATAIWYIHKKAGTYLLLLAVVTGISRVMVGVHFPFDIVLGALLGISLAWGCFKIYPTLFKIYDEKTYPPPV